MTTVVNNDLKGFVVLADGLHPNFGYGQTVRVVDQTPKGFKVVCGEHEVIVPESDVFDWVEWEKVRTI